MSFINSLIFIAVGFIGLLLVKAAAKAVSIIFIILLGIGVLGLIGYDITDFLTGTVTNITRAELVNKSLELKDCVVQACNCSQSVVIDCITQTVIPINLTT